MCQSLREGGFKGIANGMNSCATEDIEQRARDAGEEVGVFVGIGVRDGDARVLKGFNLCFDLALDVRLADLAAEQRLDEGQQRRTKGLSVGTEQGGNFVGRRGRYAIGKNDMTADAQGRVLPGNCHGVFKGCPGCHQGCRGKRSGIVKRSDGAVDPFGQAKVVSVDDEAGRHGSVVAGFSLKGAGCCCQSSLYQDGGMGAVMAGLCWRQENYIAGLSLALALRPLLMCKTDVFVCGGGPAGLAAAIAARKNGFDVVVADCFKPQIDKACGEGLMPDSVAALGNLGVVLPADKTGVFQGIRFVEGKKSVEARFPTGVGRGVRRTVLHGLLYEKAQELGVNFRWSTQVLHARNGVARTGSEEFQAKWIVGADGLHSRVREGAGLGGGRRFSRRIGLRQHFRGISWGDFMEIHWCPLGQAYVTPVGPEEICVVVVGRKRFESVQAAMKWFPQLASRLAGATPVSTVRGAVTEGHIYDRVTDGSTALIGDASGSVDAIAGQGLALSFLEAEALASALRSGDLREYEQAHRKIRRVPIFMSQTMLLLDRFGPIRRWTHTAFQRKPELFEQMLSVHVGDLPLTVWGSAGALSLCLQVLLQQVF